MTLIIQNIAKFSTRVYLLVDSDCSLKPWPISGNGFLKDIKGDIFLVDTTRKVNNIHRTIIFAYS